MGAPRVTPQEVIKIQQLYTDIGNYAAVGRIVGRSGSTVAKYVKMEGIPQNIKLAVQALIAKEKNK